MLSNSVTRALMVGLCVRVSYLVHLTLSHILLVCSKPCISRTTYILRLQPIAKAKLADFSVLASVSYASAISVSRRSTIALFVAATTIKLGLKHSLAGTCIVYSDRYP
ncbi:hypothetical protein MY4038_007655 [Beauveria bassiana]